MKKDKICMNCGSKFGLLKLRVLEKTERNFRDFCCIDCLVCYYRTCLKQENYAKAKRSLK